MIRDCLNLLGYEPGKSVEDVKKKYGVKRVVKLASNENPYGPSPKAVRAFKSYKDLHIYPKPDYAELRQKISEYTGWDYERIVVGAGIDGILESIFRLVIDAGDEVIISVPTFPYYHTLVRLHCGKEVMVKRGENFRLNENIFGYISNKTKLILICSPNNPTGNVEDKKLVEEIVQSTEALVFIDEAYVEFADEELDIDGENVVIARTFSKAFGLANLRIGYARLPEWFVKYYQETSTPFPISTPAERAAIAALEDVEWMENCVRRIKSERERLYSEMKKLVRVYPSQANFLFFETEKPSNFIAEELMKRGVIIRDCSKFIGCKNHLRVSVGKKEDNDLFLEGLKEIL